MVPSPLKPSRSRKLESSDSLAILQDQLLDPRRRSTSVGTSTSNDGAFGHSAILGLQVSIERGRLALIAGLTIAVLVTTTLVLSRDGVVVHQSTKGDLTAKQQQDLLERYNSYSGSIAAAIERPLSLFLVLMADIMVLRLMADKLLQVEQRPSLRVGTLAVRAGFGYLLSNGLSALNVQVHELPVESMIFAQDLSRQLDQNGSSTMEASYADDRWRNPVRNTILKSILLPRVLSSEPVCDGSGSMDTLDSVTFGFPQLPWMQSLLSESLDAKTMTITVGAAANTSLTPDQFPMDASVAAELLLYGVGTGGMYTFFDSFRNLTAFPTSKSQPVRYDSAARLAGLISPDASASETADREWFLAHGAKYMANITDKGQNASLLVRRTLELTHVPITPSIWMDAVTYEREMWPDFEMDRSQDGRTRYYTANKVSSSKIHVATSTGNDTIDATVQAFAVCVNHLGEETLTASVTEGTGVAIVCANKSESSLFFVTTTKRLIADELITDAIANSSGIFNGSYTVVVNLREVAVRTFARISWKLEDLADKFGAKCMDDVSGCLGLEVELPAARQRLVVGRAALPAAQLSLMVFDMFWVQQPMSIVEVTRPKNFYMRHGGNPLGWLGDFLLPHNVREIKRSVQPPAAVSSASAPCITMNEKRLATYVNNHLYMDSTLQTTYTAATFFLFQKGVALDVVSSSDKTNTTLAFSHNVQPVVMRAYIPRLNVLVTLVGCGALACVLLVVLFWQLLTSSGNDPLQRVTTPHAIARVMVDSATFPSVLLKRSVLQEPEREQEEHKAKAEANDSDVDAWLIESITLQHKPKEDGEEAREKGEVNV